MKIAINTCYGGFSLSQAVYKQLGLKWDDRGYATNKTFGIEDPNRLKYRSHPTLIEAIEAVGEEAAGGDFAEIKIVEIPDEVQWVIDERNGNETVHERHRRWA